MQNYLPLVNLYEIATSPAPLTLAPQEDYDAQEPKDRQWNLCSSTFTYITIAKVVAFADNPAVMHSPKDWKALKRALSKNMVTLSTISKNGSSSSSKPKQCLLFFNLTTERPIES